MVGARVGHNAYVEALKLSLNWCIPGIKLYKTDLKSVYQNSELILPCHCSFLVERFVSQYRGIL